MIGHLLGAAGIASALAGARRDPRRVIPPTINLRTPDPECDLDYVPLIARQAKVDTVAVNGFGFGGQNAVAIFRRRGLTSWRRRSAIGDAGFAVRTTVGRVRTRHRGSVCSPTGFALADGWAVTWRATSPPPSRRPARRGRSTSEALPTVRRWSPRSSAPTPRSEPRRSPGRPAWDRHDVHGPGRRRHGHRGARRRQPRLSVAWRPA